MSWVWQPLLPASAQQQAASGYNIVATAGSYIITGATTALERGRLLGATSGSYSLSGQTVSLERGFEVAATAGAYAVTGSPATLRRTLLLSAASGTYAITGQTVSLERGYELSATSGSYALTGADATLVYTPVGGYSLVANGGSYAVTGADAALEYGREVLATSGSYVISGSPASLELTRLLTAESGSYAVTGTDAALTVGTAEPVEPTVIGGSWLPIQYVGGKKKPVQPEEQPLEISEDELNQWLEALRAPFIQQERVAAAIEAIKEQIMGEVVQAELQGLVEQALYAAALDEQETDELLLVA